MSWRPTDAVFPGVGSAFRTAQRLAAELDGATIERLTGGDCRIDVNADGRAVAITCPPSTAFTVELFARGALVAGGRTIDDEVALAVARAWLGGAALHDLRREHPFLLLGAS